MLRDYQKEAVTAAVESSNEVQICDPAVNPDECQFVIDGFSCPRRDDIMPTLHCEYLRMDGVDIKEAQS